MKEIKDIQYKSFKKLCIRDSKISGQGLFALENIEAGELILSFGGLLCNNEERYTGKLLRSTCVGITESIILGEDACSCKDFSDYINHSCNPNAGLLDSITVIAIKKINAGEEILCDYSFWESYENWEMKNDCMCGSENCRKRIDGQYWKTIRIEDPHFDFYSPFLKRRIIYNGK